jgi:hypothetical protein
MSERWQEIHAEAVKQMHDELDGGGDSLDFEVRLCKRIAELEAKVRLHVEGNEWLHNELEALDFKSDWEGGPVDSLLRCAKKVRDRYRERPTRIKKLETALRKIELEITRSCSSELIKTEGWLSAVMDTIDDAFHGES